MGIYVEGEDGEPARPDFDIDTISLLLGENFSAFAYCKDWDAFLKYQNIFPGEYPEVQASLRHFLGDVGCIKYVPKFFVLNIEPPETKGGTILTPTQLPKFFADKGFDLHAPVDAILDNMVSYEWEEPEGSPEDWIPREDITSGKTMCQKFQGPYLKNEVNDLDQLEADGVAAGYFYYTIDSFKGENAQKEREEFRQVFEKELIEKAGPDSVKIVGEANGKKYDYVEVLAWNSKKVIDVAEAFFKSSSKCMAYFRTFKRTAEYLLLTD
ncbi:MAG: hypothetical protein LUC43_00025 [Burkholderiales bacterium]|nr:hypothetical protein [Burkholderiales bacterium]